MECAEPSIDVVWSCSRRMNVGYLQSIVLDGMRLGFWLLQRMGVCGDDLRPLSRFRKALGFPFGGISSRSFVSGARQDGQVDNDGVVVWGLLEEEGKGLLSLTGFPIASTGSL